MTIQTNFPAIKPSLLLDFANSKTVDPRITFTRSTTATYYDGKTTAKAEENLFLYSQAFDNGVWGTLNSAVTANATAAPDGTVTADTLTATASTGIHRVGQAVGTAGTTRTISVYAKPSTHNFVQFYFGSDGNAYANFNITAGAGAVGTVGSAASASIVDAGNGWYRCIMTTTSATADTSINTVLIDSATAARAQSWTTTGAEAVYLWGAQLEQRSAVTAYTATTTQPITNYVPVLLTAPAGVARFDHNPTTGESLGLLIEEQRTNLLTYSEQFDNAAWTKTNTTVTANTVVAPDGTLTGDKLVETTATGLHYMPRNVTLTAASYTYTIFAKAAERQFLRLNYNATAYAAAYFNLATGTLTSGSGSGYLSAGISSVGNGWYRCSITFT